MASTQSSTNLHDNFTKKLKTVAIALFDKSRIEMIRYYVVNNYSPSEIARIMCYETPMVRSRVQHTLYIIDVDMVKNDVVYKRLMSLEDVYDYRSGKCILCGKRKNYGDMLNHLLASHSEYVATKLTQVLGV
jgi:hypothetical protein